MIHLRKGLFSIIAIFVAGLLAMAVGLFDTPSTVMDQIGSAQLIGNLGVPEASAAGGATNRQKGFEFDLEPDGTPNSAKDREGPNQAVTGVPKLKPFAIRVGVQRDSGGGGRLKLNAWIEYDTNASFTAPTRVTRLLNTSHFQVVNNPNYNSRPSTVSELASVTDGIFVQGEAVDGDDESSETREILIKRGERSEIQFNVRATTQAIGGQQYFFRITDSGAPLDAYDDHPAITLGSEPDPELKIAFVSDRNGDSEILVINPDGSLVNLTKSPGADQSPAWSPDGGQISFQSFRGGSGEIYVMDSNGSDQTNLTNSPGATSTWSPDGTKIAFDAYRPPGSSGSHDIYVMNADGTNQVNITNTALNVEARNPAWSPNGAKIAFDYNPSGGQTHDIYLVNPDGANLTRLTTDPERDQFPAWSPDRTKIAFASYRDGNYEIYSMNADGTNQVRLTNSPGFDGHPTWSPDGTKIAFQSARDGDNEIYVMNADGSGLMNLTNNLASDSGPAWFNGPGIPNNPPGTGTVKGKVTNANTGRNLAAILVSTDTGESATTNKSGRYTIIDVQAGTRTLTASKTGYKTQTASVDVTADETTNFFFALAQE